MAVTIPRVATRLLFLALLLFGGAVSGNDTTIKGAQATGDKVLANIGGNLRIESEQDTDDYASKQQQAGISLVYGYSAGGNVSGSYSQQKTNSHYASVNEQSGIAAGSGSFDINVGGNTHLKGGVIASSADPSKNHLSTGSLTVEDIANEASAKTSSAGIGGGTGGNLTSSLVGGGLSMLGGGKENASSTTTSDIAAGTIDIRNGDSTALASLDRTATEFDTHSALKPVDLDKLQEQVELGQVAGEVGFRAAGDVAAAMQKQALTDLATARAQGDTAAESEALARLQSWGDGGNSKVLLHGLTGAAVAALGSGDVAQGALGAAGAEKAKQAMGEFLVQQGIAYGSAEYNSLMELGSAALGGAIGGGTGANTGLAGDRFNRQLHPDEISWIKGNAALFAAAEGISQEEAERRLIVEAAARVDAKINHAIGNENVDQAALSFLNRNDIKYDWGKAFQATDAEYTNSTLYADQLSGNLKNFATVYNALAASGVSKDNLQYLYHDQLLAYGQSAVGSSGKGVVGVVGGSAAAGVVAALGQVAVAACFSNPAACSQAVGNGLEVAAGDALGGHSLTAGTTAAVAGGLAAAEKLGQGLAKSQVDEVAKAAAGKAESVASSALGREGLNAYLEATPQLPTASGFINAGKVCESGCRLPPATAKEKDIADSVVKFGDPTGQKTEQLVEMIAKREGYTSLQGAKYGSNNGFDHVLVDQSGGVTIIVDSKQMTNGAFKLGSSNAGMQLSDAWVLAVTTKLGKDSPAAEAILNARRNGTLSTAVAGVNRETGDVVIVPVVRSGP